MESADVRSLLSRKQPWDSAKGMIVEHLVNVKFTDIVGYAKAKSVIYNTIILPLRVKKERLQSNFRVSDLTVQLPTAQSLLLHGPSGTGKSQFAFAIATAAKDTHIFIQASSNSIMGKYYGESEKNVKKVFEMANALHPSIIFFDEGEVLFRKRTEGSATHQTVSALFLQCMTLYPNVLVIVATNYPWNMDGAFRRRFDFKVHIGVPEKKDIACMLKHHCRDYLTLLTDTQLETLAATKEYFTGGDVANYHKEIGRHYLNFLYSQKYFKPCPLRKEVLVPSTQKDPNARLVTRAEFSIYNIDISPIEYEDMLVIMKEMPITVTQSDIAQHVSYEKNAAYDPVEEERLKEKAKRDNYYNKVSTQQSK